MWTKSIVVIWYIANHCCTPETKTLFCVNYILIKLEGKQFLNVTHCCKSSSSCIFGERFQLQPWSSRNKTKPKKRKEKKKKTPSVFIHIRGPRSSVHIKWMKKCIASKRKLPLLNSWALPFGRRWPPQSLWNGVLRTIRHRTHPAYHKQAHLILSRFHPS